MLGDGDEAPEPQAPSWHAVTRKTGTMTPPPPSRHGHSGGGGGEGRRGRATHLPSPWRRAAALAAAETDLVSRHRGRLRSWGFDPALSPPRTEEVRSRGDLRRGMEERELDDERTGLMTVSRADCDVDKVN